MDWEAIGAVGEILGAIAVVTPLGYLAIQTKQNTAATRAAARQAILESDQQLLAMMIEQPSFDSLRFTEELSLEEKSQLGLFFLMFTRMRESNWLQFNAGALDAETWASYPRKPRERWFWISRHSLILVSCLHKTPFLSTVTISQIHLGGAT